MIAPGDPERIAYVLELITARRGGIEGVTVLDLACRTGQFTTALAKAGARAVGVEGRQENLARCRRSKGTKFIQADVRTLNPDDHGVHDVTLCLGLLYHLEPADVLRLLAAMRQVTADGGFVIIDTHIGTPRTAVTVDGRQYEGSWWIEPGQAETLWSALGNLRSFWFTAGSLQQAAVDAGWSTVERVDGARWDGEPAGRLWLVLS